MNVDDTTERFLTIVPEGELERVLSQPDCEIDGEFMGFLKPYESLSQLISPRWTVFDFGCSYAAQSIYFKNHARYIGVDASKHLKEQFSFGNSSFYNMSIQDYIKYELPKYLESNDIRNCFAICNYVPDNEAQELIRNTFKNVYVMYPFEDTTDGGLSVNGNW